MALLPERTPVRSKVVQHRLCAIVLPSVAFGGIKIFFVTHTFILRLRRKATLTHRNHKAFVQCWGRSVKDLKMMPINEALQYVGREENPQFERVSYAELVSRKVRTRRSAQKCSVEEHAGGAKRESPPCKR